MAHGGGGGGGGDDDDAAAAAAAAGVDAASGDASAGVGAGDAVGGPCRGLDLCCETEDTTPCWVFWDVEWCPCPLSKLDVPDMFPKIKSIFRQWGFRGPVQMMAIGRDEMFSHPTATELTNTGVIIRSFEYEECSHLASCVLGFIVVWMGRNRPPANILLITDHHVPTLYKGLCKRNFNVLLRHQQCGSPKRENYCWSWADVLEGRPWGNLKRSLDVGVPSPSEAKRLAL